MYSASREIVTLSFKLSIFKRTDLVSRLFNRRLLTMGLASATQMARLTASARLFFFFFFFFFFFAYLAICVDDDPPVGYSAERDGANCRGHERRGLFSCRT